MGLKFEDVKVGDRVVSCTGLGGIVAALGEPEYIWVALATGSYSTFLPAHLRDPDEETS